MKTDWSYIKEDTHFIVRVMTKDSININTKDRVLTATYYDVENNIWTNIRSRITEDLKDGD